MKPQLSPPHDDTGDIIKVNFTLAYAVFLMGAGVWVWPLDPHWWGLYGLSIILQLAAFGLVINALRTIITLNRNRKFRKAIEALGSAPKNAKLTSKNSLQDAGMN